MLTPDYAAPEQLGGDEATVATDVYALGVVLYELVSGQSPWRSPSVFNFFRPGYVPPGHELAANQITAPEFQLLNESTIAGYLNFMQSVIGNGIASGDVTANYAHELSLAADAPKLLAHLNLRLAADAIHATTLSELSTAVATINASNPTGQLNRVKAAILLVMACPEYLIQK